MIFAEILKIIKNRQIFNVWLLWLIIIIALFYFIKISFINPKIYSLLGHEESFFVYQHSFFKLAYVFTNLFLVITLLIHNNLESVNMSNYKKTLPVLTQELRLAALLAMQGVFSALVLTVCFFVSFGFYFVFNIKTSIHETLVLTSIFWVHALFSTLCTLSFFFTLIKLINKKILSVIVCILLCDFAFLPSIKLFPMQWVNTIIPQMKESWETNYAYLALALMVIIFPYLHWKINFKTNFLTMLVVCSLIFTGCKDAKPSEIFVPKENVVYIAFSIECNVCDDKAVIINNAKQINLNKIEFITLDSKQEIYEYKKVRKINANLKFKTVSEIVFNELFDTMSYPQAIYFKNHKKIKLSNDFLKPENLIRYAKQQ